MSLSSCAALADASPQVREHAVLLAEPQTGAIAGLAGRGRAPGG